MASPTATVKVMVPTYRRPRLLARALASLRAQTCEDWIAEVHNDDPADAAPAALVDSLADPRIACVTHSRNLGAVATFNLCYTSGPEPFLALLEDDNAWEPTFLARVLAVLALHPAASGAWCDQHLDEETVEGGVRPLGRTVHNGVSGPPRTHPFGAVAQAFGSLHGQSALVLRRPPGDEYTTPVIPVTGIEAYRERLFPDPLVFVPEALARFTITRSTARARDRREWSALQTGLAATFARSAPTARAMDLWTQARASRPSMAGVLIQAGLADPRCRHLLKSARPSEFFRWLAGALRHPGPALSALRCRRASWWAHLAAATQARFSA